MTRTADRAAPRAAIPRHRRTDHRRRARLRRQGFPELFRWLGEHGIEPSGPPFIRFRELDTNGEPLEIEVGAPVEAEARATSACSAGSLPAGRYLTFIHLGPYRSETAPDLATAREQLVAFAAEEGIVHSRATAHGTTLPCASSAT